MADVADVYVEVRSRSLAESEPSREIFRPTPLHRRIGGWLSSAMPAVRVGTFRPTHLCLLTLVLLANLVLFSCLAVKMATLPLGTFVAVFGHESIFWMSMTFFGRASAALIVAGLLGGIGQLAGGHLSFQKILLSSMWSAIAALPVAFALALLSMLIVIVPSAMPAEETDWAMALPHWLSGLALVWFAARGAAEAQGPVRRTPFLAPALTMIFLAVLGTILALALLAMP